MAELGRWILEWSQQAEDRSGCDVDHSSDYWLCTILVGRILSPHIHSPHIHSPYGEGEEGEDKEGTLQERLARRSLEGRSGYMR